MITIKLINTFISSHSFLMAVVVRTLKNDSLGFPGGSDGKASAYNAGDMGSIPGLGRSSGEGEGYQSSDFHFYISNSDKV